MNKRRELRPRETRKKTAAEIRDRVKRRKLRKERKKPRGSFRYFRSFRCFIFRLMQPASLLQPRAVSPPARFPSRG
jgi:hypothetical protein